MTQRASDFATLLTTALPRYYIFLNILLSRAAC